MASHLVPSRRSLPRGAAAFRSIRGTNDKYEPLDEEKGEAKQEEEEEEEEEEDFDPNTGLASVVIDIDEVNDKAAKKPLLATMLEQLNELGRQVRQSRMPNQLISNHLVLHSGAAGASDAHH